MKPLSQREILAIRLAFAVSVTVSAIGLYFDNGLLALGMLGFLLITLVNVGQSTSEDDTAVIREGERLRSGAMVCVGVLFVVHMIREFSEFL